MERVHETLAAPVASNICVGHSSGHFSKVLSGLGRGGTEEEGIRAGHGPQPPRSACPWWLQLGGVRGAGALPAAPTPGHGEACSGFLPTWAHRPCWRPLAQMSATTRPVHPTLSLNNKLEFGKPALSHHLLAIVTAEK